MPNKHGTKVAPNLKSIYPSYQNIKSWALWLCSVLCVSVLISSSRLGSYLAPMQNILGEQSIERQYTAPVKRSKCADGGISGDAYDLSLHVAALFIILGTSTVACAFPILAIRFPRLHIPASFLFFVSHFGTGVLIATAFVHLLPTAFTSLGNPCLPDFWTKDYPAIPGAIALGGIFLVTIIEMVFSPAQKVCRGGRIGEDQRDISPRQERNSGDTETDIEYPNQLQSPTPNSYGVERKPHLRDMGPLIGRSSSISRTINRMNEGAEEIVRVASAPETHSHHRVENGSIQPDVERREDHPELTPDQKQKKETMQVYLLEMGILFHSVFIGMSLSVSVGNEFVILLIAIVFHRVSPMYIFQVLDGLTKVHRNI
jgi:zinc transporter ZupT